MKVLFVINQLFRGGAEGALVNLLSAMSADKYEIDLLIYDQIDLPDTVSLIPNVSSHVRVHNIADGERKIAYIKKAIHKVYKKIVGQTPYRKRVYKFLRDNEYDVAISFGEWFSSALVAKYTKSKRKYVWIHADADKADFFHPDIYRYHDCFDGFIFVSNNSRLAAERQYPFLTKRSYVVNNITDDAEIKKLAALNSDVSLPTDNLPCLVTVANVRPEKNHMRQLRVMKKLFDEGHRFYWINVGSTANLSLTDKILTEVKTLGLQDYFIFTGATNNPYAVIKRADAVCVLSDHESWSMVITEAKVLGVPVIATKTSGATEQLSHLENGVLCDFEDEDIAEKIRSFLLNPDIGENIRNKLLGFSSVTDTLAVLDSLLLDDRKKLLYVFDDINYISGARAATLMQADRLCTTARVDLFSVTSNTDDKLSSRYHIIDIENNKCFKILSIPIKEALTSREYSKRAKLLRVLYALFVRLGMDVPLYRRLLRSELTGLFSSYDAIIVVSEASKLRHFISTLEGPTKIQWIHTDYAAWRCHSGWTRKITRKDGKTYKNYDTIVCLSETIRNKFTALYPHLSNKTVAIPNLIDYDGIMDKSKESCDFHVDKSKLNIITIGRMESEKRYDRILLLAKGLMDHGTDFVWYLVGDGNLLSEHKASADEMGLCGRVIFTGYMKNACPLLKECDMFVLLSEYEGTPVTIDEAKVLGVPVLAKNVGGIADQLNERYGMSSETISVEDIMNFDSSCTKLAHKREFLEYNKKITDKLKSILE